MITLFFDNEDDEGRRTGGTRLKERPMLYQRLNDDEQIHRFYDFGDELGRGKFGVVMRVRAQLTGLCWAIKVIEKSQAKNQGMKLLEREIRILRLISHPNIIYLEKVYETPKNLYLVLELCTGTLAKEFYERRPFSEADTREVIRKLASAVAYLHSNGIVHRDLKLENILLTTNPDDPEDKLYIKVTDFGQSVVRSGVAYDQMLHERCGTMAYMGKYTLLDAFTLHRLSEQIPPTDAEGKNVQVVGQVVKVARQSDTVLRQVNAVWGKLIQFLKSQQRLVCPAPEVMELRMYSHQCDVWSMGVITYLLLVGDFPFTGDSPEQLRQRVLNDELRFGRKSLSNLLHSSKYAFSVKQ
ncbi:serine/threonine-protein kinase 33-like [Schistocerca gregaria]|uniref:serine/threonine-protein kinase 33-like n=1 Tax=Schistocerca gregaria TaxID=7010 RepID=UPI00211DD8CD|nr:serine/threonine-protein kinase 33-like [Schistocerca gregaria]